MQPRLLDGRNLEVILSNVPLPIRSCIVTYMGDGRGLHYTLGVAAGTALIEQPPGSQLDLYTADQMHAHAAAVSAAKDAEIAALRAELIKSLADNAALRAEVAGLREFVEHVRRNGGTHLANMAIAVLAAWKGEA